MHMLIRKKINIFVIVTLLFGLILSEKFMKHTDNVDLRQILATTKSFEDFEQIKQNTHVVEAFVQEITNRHKMPNEKFTLFQEGTNLVIGYGNNHVIKIFPPFHKNHFENEVLVLHHLKNKISVSIPEIKYEGKIEGWPYFIMSKLKGSSLEGLWENLNYENKIILIKELGALIHEVHSLTTKGLEKIDCHWTYFIENQIKNCFLRHKEMKMPEFLLREISNYLQSTKQTLPKLRSPVILTGEYTPMNILVNKEDSIWHIVGLIDFGDSMLGMPEYDLLGPGAFLIQGDKKLLKEFLAAYGYPASEMTRTLSQQLTTLMLLHRYSNLNVQIRIKDWQNKINNLKDLETLVWGL